MPSSRAAGRYCRWRHLLAVDRAGDAREDGGGQDPAGGDEQVRQPTAIGYADEAGVQVVTGTLNGTLTTELCGTNGFGYDPIFIPDGHHRTYAEMSSEEKNAVSHRRLAVEELRKALNVFN